DLDVLRTARESCDHLIVGIMTDELAELTRGRPPFVPLVERMEIIRNVRYADSVVPVSDLDVRLAHAETGFHVFYAGPDLAGLPTIHEIERALTGRDVRVEQITDVSETASGVLRAALAGDL